MAGKYVCINSSMPLLSTGLIPSLKPSESAVRTHSCMCRKLEQTPFNDPVRFALLVRLGAYLVHLLLDAGTSK